MYSQNKKIFGTDLEILIPKDENFEKDKADKAIDEVFDLFEKYDKIFSRFREDSELSILNANRTKIVSEPFLELIKLAIKFSKETRGVFNPLVNLSSIGYSKDFYSKEFKKQGFQTSLDIDAIKMNEKTQTVTLLSNSIIDLGGCAKGFTVDKAALILDKYFPNFLVNAGGDLYAKGLFHGEKWEVGIANPRNENEDLDIIPITNKAIATSGNNRRKWVLEGNEFGHIVSGQTNEQVENDLSCVTVIANTTLEADVFAKTAFILGQEEGRNFLLRKKIEGYFVLI